MAETFQDQLIKHFQENGLRADYKRSEAFQDSVNGQKPLGFEISEKNNKLLLQCGEEWGTVYLSGIWALEKGTGLGTRVIEALYSFCNGKGCRLVVYKIANPEFFDRFDWLEKDGFQSRKYNPLSVKV